MGGALGIGTVMDISDSLTPGLLAEGIKAMAQVSQYADVPAPNLLPDASFYEECLQQAFEELYDSAENAAGVNTSLVGRSFAVVDICQRMNGLYFEPETVAGQCLETLWDRD